MNCTGLGARLTAADPTVTPVRGQVMTVEQCRSGPRWLTRPPALRTSSPASNDMVVGGTSERRLEPWPSTGDHGQILTRAAELVPELPRRRSSGSASGSAPPAPTCELVDSHRRRHPLLRPRRLRRHPLLGLRGRGRRARARMMVGRAQSSATTHASEPSPPFLSLLAFPLLISPPLPPYTSPHISPSQRLPSPPPPPCLLHPSDPPRSPLPPPLLLLPAWITSG